MLNTQEIICKAYGFKEIFPLENIVKSVKAREKLKMVQDNKTECAMCGQVHSKGYVSTENGHSLLQAIVPDTYNKCYSLKPKNFICEYCGWSTVSYGSPTKLKFGKKIINSLVSNNTYKNMYFNSDANNELYNLLKNPPRPPFVILINSGGTVIENLVFTAKATISKEFIIVNYGSLNLGVEPNEVFECLREANRISNFSNGKKNKKIKLEPTSDNLFNRQNDVKITPKKEVLEQEDIRDLLSSFILKYDRDTRLVAKMVQKAFLADKTVMEKNGHEAVSEETKQNSQSNIFDYIN